MKSKKQAPKKSPKKTIDGFSARAEKLRYAIDELAADVIDTLDDHPEFEKIIEGIARKLDVASDNLRNATGGLDDLAYVCDTFRDLEKKFATR
jgi:hypothetical protein